MAFLSEALNLCGQLDAQTTSGLTIAVVLALIWIFFKLVRKIVAVTFFLCLVYIGLHYCGVDILSLLGK